VLRPLSMADTGFQITLAFEDFQETGQETD
jgi:hypothetical protein